MKRIALCVTVWAALLTGAICAQTVISTFSLLSGNPIWKGSRVLSIKTPSVWTNAS